MSQRFRPIELASGLILVLALGCGGPKVTDPSNAEIPAQGIGPHGGASRPLGEKATVELLTEFPPGGNEAQPVVAAYFFQPGSSTPLASTPTVVSVKLQSPAGEIPETPLLPDPKPANGQVRFASKPLDYGEDRVVGELTATVEGETFNVQFQAN